ncbi:hypothetical protein ACT3OH_07690 [Vreelandella zhanjiangensis]
MKYQDNFPTIWDTPLKQAKPAKNTAAQPPASFKEVFLTIWDSAKRKSAA